mmetsp:Transcript_128605/g.222182  ORF Transcript_128605/g.222182 Transcript_128605/m.222182 type:complete len:232 (-) Transcript_128605:834-1529(-)
MFQLQAGNVLITLTVVNHPLNFPRLIRLNHPHLLLKLVLGAGLPQVQAVLNFLRNGVLGRALGLELLGRLIEIACVHTGPCQFYVFGSRSAVAVMGGVEPLDHVVKVCCAFVDFFLLNGAKLLLIQGKLLRVPRLKPALDGADPVLAFTTGLLELLGVALVVRNHMQGGLDLHGHGTLAKVQRIHGLGLVLNGGAEHEQHCGARLGADCILEHQRELGLTVRDVLLLAGQA